MSEDLNLLLVEDYEDDAFLLVRELEKGGFKARWERVDTPLDLAHALENNGWDIVIADYSLPGFSGLEALKIIKEKGYDYPLIMVSGAVGEEMAVEAMRAGAHDYILKDKLTRLVPAIKRELGEAKIRAEVRRAENALRESEQRFQDIVANTGDWIWEVDANGAYTYSSPASKKVLGYEPIEVLGKHFYDFFLPEEREELRTKAFEVFKSKKPFKNFLNNNIRKDGSIVILETSGVPITGFNGELLGYRGADRDITKRVMAEKALKESEGRLQAILDNTSAAVFLKDIEGRFILINNYLEKLWGMDKEKWTGKTDHDLFPKEIADRLRKNDMEVLRRREPVKFEESVNLPDGERTYISVKFPLFDSSGEPYATCGISTDITDRKRSEKELHLAKEEAEAATILKDKFVSLVAHDLKSPLASLMGLLKLIDRDEVNPAHSKHKNMLHKSVNSGERMIKMIDELLDLDRLKKSKISLKPILLDCHAIVGDIMESLAEAANKKGVELVNDFPESAKLRADEELLSVVLGNLLSNAVKFCDKGGKVRVFKPSGRKSAIAVKDNGLGINEKILPNIFRFDVKTSTIGTAGETGTGLGLPLCREIVEAHGGRLFVESAVGEGSVFYIELPGNVQNDNKPCMDDRYQDDMGIGTNVIEE